MNTSLIKSMAWPVFMDSGFGLEGPPRNDSGVFRILLESPAVAGWSNDGNRRLRAPETRAWMRGSSPRKTILGCFRCVPNQPSYRRRVELSRRRAMRYGSPDLPICEPEQAELFLAPVFWMELTHDIGNGAPFIDADGAGSADALAHGPRPAGRQFAEPGTTGIVPVQPQNRGAGGPLVTGLE